MSQPETEPVTNWHELSTKDTVARTDSNGKDGLTTPEARRRLEQYGPNALPEKEESSLLMMFLGQFGDPLIFILFGAAALALVLGHTRDAVVIFVVVTINALIGTFQERRAERSMNALRRHAQVKVTIIRDGKKNVIEAKELVPGDVLLFVAGDKIGADARLIMVADLETDEAALTGESLPVEKHPAPRPAETPLADRVNMVYAGTQVTSGTGRAIVVATGVNTEIGKIATLAEESEQPPTPLEAKIAQFGKLVIWAALALFGLVILVGKLRGLTWEEVLLVGASQMVSMIPEGLPIAMTIALAVGMQRMAARGAIVRQLAACETLGSTTTICSDKTGTLTKSELTATTIWFPGGGEKGEEIAVTGVGYDPTGILKAEGAPTGADLREDVRVFLEACVLCNDASLHRPTSEEPRWTAVGDPTEAALLTLAWKGGVIPAEIRDKNPRRAEIPFDSKTRMMATRCAGEHEKRVYLKGALEKILSLCGTVRVRDDVTDLDDETRARIEAAEGELGDRALRVLAVAVVDEDASLGEQRTPEEKLLASGVAPASQREARFEALRGRATFLGLVGQYDPPRPEVKDSVIECRRAGIRPVMVTGDHRATGLAISRELGIAREGDLAITGAELDTMSKEELAGKLDRVSVFARVHPEHKHRIVEAYQKAGHVVAMTGDGVNDAPALAQADVGVAMGLSGTEVAKEAAEIVITDDNFATIVDAVEEGRVVYGNIQKVVLYLFATLASEVLILLGALFLGYPLPLIAVQILWINLVTETPVTINLVMEPKEGDEMDRDPIPKGEPLVGRDIRGRLALQLGTMTVAGLGYFMYLCHVHEITSTDHPMLPFARTATFTLIAICCWLNALNCRSAHRTAFDLRLLQNKWLTGGLAVGITLHAAVIYAPPLQALFQTTPLTLAQLGPIALIASSLLWVEEIRKLIARVLFRKRNETAAPAAA